MGGFAEGVPAGILAPSKEGNPLQGKVSPENAPEGWIRIPRGLTKIKIDRQGASR